MGQHTVDKVTYNQFEELFTTLAAQNKFNGNIWILEKGETIYKNALGFANYKTKEALTYDTVFELASVSKPFTAMGILVLKERGKLDDDHLVDRYFPNFPYKDITIKHLLTHTSGLPDYMDLFEQHWDKTKIATNDDVIEQLIQHQPDVLFQPNERYEYSNTGYVLLASIIEQVAGMPYSEFMQQDIFAVLEMERTKVHNGRYTGETIPNYAHGHIYSAELDQYIFPDESEDHDFVFYLDGIQGDGVVNSTIEDLQKWDRALYTEKLVKKNTLLQAFSPIAKMRNEPFDYGYGWRISHSKDTGKVVYHGGSWPGYRNWLSRFIDQDKTIIYLTNVEQSREWTEEMIKTIENILFNRPYTIPSESK